MTTATPKKTKAVRQPTCPHCKKRFRTTSIKKAYCTTQCQKEATKKKRRVTRIDRASNSAFLYHLAYECERAETLQILTGHTVESLVQLYEIYKLKLKANRYGECKDFEISHIHPVKGHDTLGLYCAENLVVSPTKLNRCHGTTHHAHGRSIPRASLQSRHCVEKGASRKSTVQRIIKFIGADVVEEVVRIAKIQSTQRHKVLSWLHDHLDPTVPEHRVWLEGLDDMCTKTLSGLKAKLEGKEGSDFKIKTESYSPLKVLLLGLEQQTVYRPELSVVHDAIYAALSPFISVNFSSEWVRYWTLIGMVESLQGQASMRGLMADSELLQALFDVLHGASIDAIHPALEAFTARYSGAVEQGQAIKAVQPPVLVGTLSFADELDLHMRVPDVVPILRSNSFV